MMLEFRELGLRVQRLWKNCDFSKCEFSKIAYSELSKFSYSKKLEDLESNLADWIVNDKIPSQLNVYNNFGQPPITVFNNGKFVIDLYFWLDVDTSIHSHSFNGAFKVLFGRSFQEEFSVNTMEKIADDVMISDIQLKHSELLPTGRVVEIFSGSCFNHRVVHLERPTISLCIRTIDDKKQNQWHHFSNGLSISKREIEEKHIKSLLYYDYLFNNKLDESYRFIVKVIQKWEISIVMNIFEQLLNDGMGLSSQSCEWLVQYISEFYAREKWYQMYESYCDNMESWIRLEQDSASNRFIEIALNSKYSLEKSIPILESIQNTKATREQIKMLSSKL